MKLKSCLVVVLFALSGCADGESAAQDAVRAALKDPDSAKFGEFTKAKTSDGVVLGCMTVNAKNSMGGYTGNQQASLGLIDGKWTVGGLSEVSHSECVAKISSK
ncbi:MAG: hypothetical protein V4723_21925 [Pseudomonadota bacterium]